MVLLIISAHAENMAYMEAAHRRKRKEYHPGKIPPAANMLLGGQAYGVDQVVEPMWNTAGMEISRWTLVAPFSSVWSTSTATSPMAISSCRMWVK